MFEEYLKDFVKRGYLVTICFTEQGNYLVEASKGTSKIDWSESLYTPLPALIRLIERSSNDEC